MCCRLTKACPKELEQIRFSDLEVKRFEIILLKRTVKKNPVKYGQVRTRSVHYYFAVFVAQITDRRFFANKTDEQCNVVGVV